MKHILSQSVGQCMTRNVISVKSDESLKKVFQIMDKHGILGLPVVNEAEEVVGMVTESDLIAHVTILEAPSVIPLLGSLIYLESPGTFNEALKSHCAETVGEMMTKEVIIVQESSPLSQAIEKMAEFKINRLPVVSEKGKLVGILTRSDVVHQLAKLKTV